MQSKEDPEKTSVSWWDYFKQHNKYNSGIPKREKKGGEEEKEKYLKKKWLKIFQIW